jgi:hypothetical protein
MVYQARPSFSGLHFEGLFAKFPEYALYEREVLFVQTISIKSSSPEKSIPLLANAIERERRIVMDSLKTARGRVESLAKDLGVDVDKLMRGEVEHADADDMKLIELEGEAALLKHLESELKGLQSLEICR